MKNNGDRASKGLNQIFEIINAKGDRGELQEIVKKTNNDQEEDMGVTVPKQNRPQ